MAELYRHYKGQYYLLHSEVIHSETLEKLVYYESLYDNPKGKLWVRPHAMFFEDIEVQGKKRPRFEKVKVQYVEKEELDENEKKALSEFFISEKIFPEFEEKKFLYQLEIKSRLHCAIAMIDNQIIAVKMGYVLSPYKFYSWMGGVAPKFRGCGIASQLMKNQHEWCRKKKFLLIETRTRNQFADMISLNLKHGFQIVGTKVDKRGEMKILFEKKL